MPTCPTAGGLARTRCRVGDYQRIAGYRVLNVHAKGGMERRVPFHAERPSDWNTGSTQPRSVATRRPRYFPRRQSPAMWAEQVSPPVPSPAVPSRS